MVRWWFVNTQMSAAMARTPGIAWAQRTDVVLISCSVPGVQSVSLRDAPPCRGVWLTLGGEASGAEPVALDLFAPVAGAVCSRGRVVLQKAGPAEWWPRLTLAPQRLAPLRIACDWDAWVAEDSSSGAEEEEEADEDEVEGGDEEEEAEEAEDEAADAEEVEEDAAAEAEEEEEDAEDVAEAAETDDEEETEDGIDLM